MPPRTISTQCSLPWPWPWPPNDDDDDDAQCVSFLFFNFTDYLQTTLHMQNGTTRVGEMHDGRGSRRDTSRTPGRFLFFSLLIDCLLLDYRRTINGHYHYRTPRPDDQWVGVPVFFFGCRTRSDGQGRGRDNRGSRWDASRDPSVCSFFFSFLLLLSKCLCTIRTSTMTNAHHHPHHHHY